MLKLLLVGVCVFKVMGVLRSSCARKDSVEGGVFGWAACFFLLFVTCWR